MHIMPLQVKVMLTHAFHEHGLNLQTASFVKGSRAEARLPQVQTKYDS